MSIFGNILKRTLSIGDAIKPTFLTPVQIQEKTLRRLLLEAQFTSFGRHYHFRDLLKHANLIEAFQKAVPVHDYNKMHDEWWQLQLKGHDFITWSSKIQYYGLSSGTSGAPSKFIPESEEMLRSMRKAGYKMFFKMAKQQGISSDIFTKDFLMIGGTTTLNDHGKYFSGDLSGINASLAPFWFRRYRPGKKIAKIKDWNARLEEIARKAPKWDIVAAMGLPSWVQLVLEKVIEYHKLDNIHQIWPNFQIFVSGGIALDPYKSSLNKLFDKPVLYADTYLASEGFIAFQTHPDARGMSMVLNNGIFYEFIPFDENNFDDNGLPQANAEVLTINEVKENVDYALLLTTNAGSWRYLLGDTIRFINVVEAQIIISGRTKHFISICGEHLSVDNMTCAIQYAQEQMNISIPEFTVLSKKADSHFSHLWYIGSTDVIDLQKFNKNIDDFLKSINDDYAAERDAMLQAPNAIIVEPKVFYKYLEKEGKSMGQSKFPRVLKGVQIYAWEDYLQQFKN
ncbi:MAG: GH3 family domain-containing protein [Saprospiraceae bacterium]